MFARKRLARLSTIIIVLSIIAHFFIYPHAATAVAKIWTADVVAHSHYTYHADFCYTLYVVVPGTMKPVKSGSHWDTYHASGEDSESHESHKIHLDATIVDTIGYVHEDCPG